MTLKNKIQELKECICYTNMKELRDICNLLELPSNGKKGDIINRIITFLETGNIIKPTAIPEISRGQKGKKYPLHPHTLIVYGNYKNDYKTRIFMKSLVGKYFHFTAFGQDYIKKKWLNSNPPTYQEFADYWKKEFEKRKISQVSPKQEWTYLNFIKTYLKEFPQASRKQISFTWKKLRKEKAQQTKELIKYFIKSISSANNKI